MIKIIKECETKTTHTPRCICYENKAFYLDCLQSMLIDEVETLFPQEQDITYSTRYLETSQNMNDIMGVSD